MQATKLRQTKKQSNTGLRGPRKAQNAQGTLINQQKRDKLKGIITQRLIKELGPSVNEEIVSREVSKFFTRDKLTASDLKKLEKDLKVKLSR